MTLDPSSTIVQSQRSRNSRNQLLLSSSDSPGSPNNVIRNEVTRYVKDKLELKTGSITVLKKTLYPHLGQLVRVYLSLPPFLVASERPRGHLKLPRNVGDTRLRLRRTRASRANSGIQRISRLRPQKMWK